jgi:hypothetical protein
METLHIGRSASYAFGPASEFLLRNYKQAFMCHSGSKLSCLTTRVFVLVSECAALPHMVVVRKNR